MANWSERDRVPVAALSRRRLLSTLAIATSAALFTPPRGEPRPVLAQTPAATPGTTMPNTLATDASPRFRAVAEALMAAMITTGTPGAALGILADGREEHATFGVDRIERGMPVTGDTLFQIGSITKTFTGTAVMRLVDEGALDLNATVRTYLPDFRLENEDVAARATLRHLLTHTGGWWGDFFVDTGAGDDAIAGYVEQWVPTLPQLTPLGEYVNYNNSGFTLLGRLIEVATGQEYRAALHALVLDPLGLNSSVFAPDEGDGPPARRRALHRARQHPEPGAPLFLPRAVDPRAGSGRPHRICSATRASISATVQPQASPILQQETLEQMQTAQQAFRPARVGDRSTLVHRRPARAAPRPA